MRQAWRFLSLAVLVCAGAGPAPTPVNPALWPAPAWPVALNPAHEAQIAALLQRMSVEEKVGQVIQADIASVTPEDVRRYHLGSILNGGNSAPGGDEFAPAAAWLALADRFHAASVDKGGGRTAIPVMWGTDAVHGHSNIVGATLFPHNVGLGAANDVALIRRIAEATAIEIRTTGMEWTFAPTITVPQDWRWGRAYEGYSSDPALVARYADAMIRGLQGEPGAGPILAGPHVLASTKHFIADGGTEGGRDQGDATIGEDVLIAVHAPPYEAAVRAGVGTIMASFSSWNGTKITAHRGLLTEVLKERMNFGGLIVSDWNAHGQVHGCTNASCPQALAAGLDMYMAPDSWRDLHRSLTAQVKAGEVPMARLDDAVARILRVKLRLGLFEAGKPSARPLSGRFDLLGAPAHRALAREAVRKSLVLLKNEGGILPLKPGANVLIAGEAADDIGRQSGGWTLTWQGTGVDNSRFPGATSIRAGLEAAVKAAGGRASYSPDGRFTGRPDAAIVVFGETPYAEFQGDLETLRLKPENRGHLPLMQRLRAAGVPIIAVMLTGRPLYQNPELNLASAFVVAWLPGSEGGGVADLLVRQPGGAAHDFTGRLPVAWPLTARADGPVLFPRGHGLGLASRTALAALPEDAGVPDDSRSAGLYFDRGVPAASWSLNVTDGAGDSTRVTAVPVAALGGRVRVTSTDDGVQEGARRFDIRGGAVVEIAAQEPVDLSRESNGDVLLVIRIRIDEAPGAPVRLAVRCGTGCAGSVPVPAAAIAALGQGRWGTLGVPLKCFARSGANVARIDAPLQIVTGGNAAFSLARVALGTEAERVLPCG